MTARCHAGVVLTFCAYLTGCAGPGPLPHASATARLAGTRTISAQDVKDAITPGKSTRADVIAALGKTTVVSFDSGYEVWVYQYASDAGETAARPTLLARIEHTGLGKATPAKTEFVVLFSPSGIVTKTRVRPTPLPE